VLGCFAQAVLVLRWFLDDIRRAQPPQATRSAYRPPTGTCTKASMCAAGGPDLHGALSAAKAAGCSHASLDGTLIAADRVATPGPTPGVDL
jgi:hypothetical protein